MTETLLLFLAPFAVLIPPALILRAKMARDEKEAAERENEAGEAAVADALREIEEEGAVRAALRSAWDSLKRQNGAGYSCWLSACISRLNAGETVPRNVALLALRYTRKEMAGPRFEKEGCPTVYFNLSGLDAAISALEN